MLKLGLLACNWGRQQQEQAEQQLHDHMDSLGKMMQSCLEWRNDATEAAGVWWNDTASVVQNYHEQVLMEKNLRLAEKDERLNDLQEAVQKLYALLTLVSVSALVVVTILLVGAVLWWRLQHQENRELQQQNFRFQGEVQAKNQSIQQLENQVERGKQELEQVKQTNQQQNQQQPQQQSLVEAIAHHHHHIPTCVPSPSSSFSSSSGPAIVYHHGAAVSPTLSPYQALAAAK